jgi:hypothetical protein
MNRQEKALLDLMDRLSYILGTDAAPILLEVQRLYRVGLDAGADHHAAQALHQEKTIQRYTLNLMALTNDTPLVARRSVLYALHLGMDLDHFMEYLARGGTLPPVPEDFTHA